MTSMNRKTNSFHLFTLLIALAFVPACTPTIAQRGHMVEERQMAKINVGEDMRSDVLKTLGSPTTQSTFDPDIWYYIGQTTEKRGILDPEVIEERIVMVKFDPETGTVKTIEEIDRERLNIPIARDKTETRGNKKSALQQLFGNLGKFNPPAE